MKFLKGYSIYIVLFVVFLFILAVNNGGVKPEPLYYAQLLTEIKNANVSELVLDGETAYVKLKNAEKSHPGYSLVLPDRTYFIEWVTPYVEQDQFENRYITKADISRWLGGSYLSAWKEAGVEVDLPKVEQELVSLLSGRSIRWKHHIGFIQAAHQRSQG